MSTVLIVDDDPEISDIFRIFLEKEGYTPIIASDGNACLESLKNHPCDVILLDIMMAPMDGWETLMRIKTNPQTCPVPVIMISGKSLDGKEQEKYGAMFYQYLMKPLRRIELCDAVRRALDSG